MTDEAELDNNEIDLEACLWVTKIDGGDMNSADYRALKDWILADEKHKKAFETYASDFLVVDDILSTVREAITDLEKKVGAVRDFGTGSVKSMRSRRANWWPRLAGGLVAASVAAIAFMTFDLAPTHSTSGETETHFVAQNGPQKRVTLADGSSVTMNTDSEIRIAYTPSHRVIELSHGEAVFDVVKDPARPFTVTSGDTSVRAIGTVFSVRALADGVEVLVEEGVVELTPPEAMELVSEISQSNRTIRLEEGGYTRVSLASGISQKAEDLGFVERKLSWREGVLSFDQDLLSEVVLEFNRYSDQEIIIVDSELAELKIGGVFPLERADAFLDALETGFSVNVEQTASGRIEISKEK